MDRTTTTTDSLGIVSLATAAVKRGQLTETELQTIVKCADDFTRALSLANKYRELTGKSLPLDDLPSPTALRQCLERQDYSLALKEVAMIKTHMQVLLHAARQQLSPLRVRIDDLLD